MSESKGHANDLRARNSQEAGLQVATCDMSHGEVRLAYARTSLKALAHSSDARCAVPGSAS